DICSPLQNLIRPASDLRRLLCVQSFCDQIIGVGRHFILEEERSELNTIIQCNKPFADERNDLQQSAIVHIESLTGEVRLEAGCQVFGREEADVRRVEMIQFLEVDRGGRGSQ